MTTMISPASPLLFDPDTHTYVLRGQDVPSVTGVLRFARYIRLFEDLFEHAERGTMSWVDALTVLERRMTFLEAARKRGQDVHALLQFMVEGDLDESSIDDAYRGYVESGRAYIRREVQHVYGAEVRVWSDQRKYAGTVDLLAVHHDGYVSVDDFKTGDPEDVAADVQLAAYLNAILEMQNYRDHETGALLFPDIKNLLSAAPKLVKRRSLRLFKDGTPAQETLYPDTYGDLTRFFNALNVVHDHRRKPVPAFDWADAR